MSDVSDTHDGPPTLTAYAVGEEHLQLAPAPSGRDWMDRTHLRFANRCLPMLMANQSGWFLVSKLDVTVTWNGGPGKEALSIQAPAAPPGRSAAVSIFGHGILTWHIPYLFRTPPGFNLLVRGPANWPRDNAFALEGLVETDWAVATFTMNYRILRPGVPVTFRAGEPVCMIVPQRRRELEAFHPFIRSIDDDPGARESYRRWAASRAEFLQSLAATSNHPNPGGLWQKHYFRGTAPDGTSGGVHQTKRELGPFAEAGGQLRPVGIDPIFDALAGPAGRASRVHASYVICTSPRSGSTLLAEALAATQVAGRPDEFFDVHPHIEAVMRRRFDAEHDPLDVYLAKILNREIGTNGVFGWKAHWHQFEHFWRTLLGVPLADPGLSRGVFAQVFPNLRYIWLRRRDRLRQAVSYAKAMQTDLWRKFAGDATQKPKAAAAFDKAIVDARIDEIARMDAAWDAFFQRHGIQPQVIWYEDFVADYANTVLGLLRHLEVRLPANFAFPQPRLLKQADEETEKWIEQYRAT